MQESPCHRTRPDGNRLVGGFLVVALKRAELFEEQVSHHPCTHQHQHIVTDLFAPTLRNFT
jgi:hypothetical protein